MNNHKAELTKHCRVCGKRFSRKSCQKNKQDDEVKYMIKQCYGISVDEDTNEVHPLGVCYGCICQMKRVMTAQNTAFFQPSTSPFLWKQHTDVGCIVCQHFESTSKGGRPKKRTSGRPSGECVSHTIAALPDLAGDTHTGRDHVSVSTSRLTSLHVEHHQIACIICKCIVNAPIQLGCDNLACWQCLHQHLVNNGQVCVGCTETLDTFHMSRCTALILSVVQNLRVKCKFDCSYSVPLKDLCTHEQSCSDHENTALPRYALRDVTLAEIIQVPSTQPLSADEEILLSKLVKRATGGGDSFVVKTGGQVHVQCICNMYRYHGGTLVSHAFENTHNIYIDVLYMIHVLWYIFTRASLTNTHLYPECHLRKLPLVLNREDAAP